MIITDYQLKFTSRGWLHSVKRNVSIIQICLDYRRKDYSRFTCTKDLTMHWNVLILL